jgi:hypothetical protein
MAYGLSLLEMAHVDEVGLTDDRGFAGYTDPHGLSGASDWNQRQVALVV